MAEFIPILKTNPAAVIPVEDGQFIVDVSGDSLKIAVDHDKEREEFVATDPDLEKEVEALAEAVDELAGEIESIKNLGSHVGTFNTRAMVPANVSGFAVITINDFVNIRIDETHGGVPTRYIASAIAADGTITWTFDIAYNTDITGKMDTVPDAVDGNVAVFEDGKAVDSGLAIDDITGGEEWEFIAL